MMASFAVGASSTTRSPGTLGEPVVLEQGVAGRTKGHHFHDLFQLFPRAVLEHLGRKEGLLQQIAVSKFGTKIEEKLLKGGSYVTLPEG